VKSLDAAFRVSVLFFSCPRSEYWPHHGRTLFQPSLSAIFLNFGIGIGDTFDETGIDIENRRYF